MNQELTNLINSLSVDNFRELVKGFLKAKYGTQHIRIIDGPYDGGLDLEIFIGDKEIKRNIQITVQKTGIDAKLEEDLVKAQKNAIEYGYLSNLDFYLSQNLSKEKRLQLILRAEIEYQVNLNIIDARILSEESVNYPIIADLVYKSHNYKGPERFNIADKQTKILFDVLTLDHNSIEIKKNFINSYVFSYLFTNPNSTLDQIFTYTNTHLKNTLSKEFLEKEVNNLKGKGFLVTPTDKKKFSLSDEKSAEIETIFEKVENQESEFKFTLIDFFQKYKIECDSNEVVDLLYKLYKENYTIDIDEVKSNNNSFSASIKKTYNDLISYFTRLGVPKDRSEIITKELVQICKDNEFLNKLSSTYLFNDLYSSDKLEKYVNDKNQLVFLDTQILIRLICVLYDSKINFTDIAMQSVKILYSTIRKFKDKVKLISSYDYVGEVAGHLYEAYKLQRFLNLPFITKLGNSKNVFYNTFSELYNSEILPEGMEFIDFIEELLDADLYSLNERDFLKLAEDKISDILEQLNIELIYHPNYPNYLSIKKEYEISLAYQSKSRSYKATENDLRTILYLSSKENHLNPESGHINEPFLITWDSAFYTFRKELVREHKELGYWYIYSPLKLVDRLSVMNFQLNPQSISLNIVALTETNFNYSTRTSSFLDVISSFFNTQNVDELSIIHKLARLKDNSRELDVIPIDDDIKERENEAFTNILVNLKNYYNSYEAKFAFNDVIDIFEMPKNENLIISIFENTLANYKKRSDLGEMFSQFDDLITANKE
ncbi:hypothetical protein [Sphingobacterium puteale]|uniref:hypothetical protein n=1 Tax=Sphingobacterium puteale TaxID=2420510 RepID=UPI003D97C19E